MKELKEYAFDVGLLATVRLSASSEDEARAMMADAFTCVDPVHNNCLVEVDGVMLTSFSLGETAPSLYEVDGEEVNSEKA